MRRYITNSPEGTEALAARLASRLKGAEVIAMFGGLGAGKTAFTRGLAAGLGINDGVSSPTFALVHEYSGKYTLYHFDMYRINTWDDLYSTGFFDYQDGGVLMIEWSENIVDFLPEDRIEICIRITGENSREIEIKGGEEYEDLGD